MLRVPILHSITNIRTPFTCRLVSALNSSVISTISYRGNRVFMSAKSMAGKSVSDVLMGAARAAAGKKGRPPLKHQAKVEEAKKAVIAEEASQNKSIAAPSVDDKIALLTKKAADFDPRAAAFWKDGENVPFLFLARALDLISNESGRIAITEILCNAFRTVIATTPGDLLPVVYLSANKVAPAHEGVELGIGDAAIIKALAEAFGRKEDQVKSQMKTLGDLGLVAKASRSTQRLMVKPTPLTCVKVLESFRIIAKESGKESQDKKRARMKALLVAATDCEPQYLVRLLQTKMRIGLAEQTVLVALGHAAVYSRQPSVLQPQLEEAGLNFVFSQNSEAGKILKHTYSVLPIYDKIVPALLEVGVSKLPEVCKFTLGVPVGPMLAKPTKGVSEILDKFQDIKFTCEYKYDGERAQIHYMEDGSVEIYSRNAERNTGKFPDVVNFIAACKKPSVTSFVLDCEVVAFDRERQKILPFQPSVTTDEIDKAVHKMIIEAGAYPSPLGYGRFPRSVCTSVNECLCHGIPDSRPLQVLSTRARKGVIISDIKVQVCIFAFDMLSLNGEPLLQEQLKVRRESLYNSFEEEPGKFLFATAKESNDLEEIQTFLEEAVNNSCEGLIIKTLEQDATYEPAKRSNNWLKLKKDYMDSIGDSLDLVPIGAFHGRGKRTGVYGAFLLACYDEENEEYQSICKIGTGFSEAVLEERSASLRTKVIPTPKSYYRYGEALGVEVWFEPTEVWEVKAADLSISPIHRAANGVVDPVKGISLRFPRLLRVREDKIPEQATTAEQVAEMYRAQKINHAGNQGDDDDD